VVTSLEEEHLDHYRDINDIKEAFLHFINQVPFYGLAVLCGDEQNLQSLLPQVDKPYVTYGLTSSSHYHARDFAFCRLQSSFTAYRGDKKIGQVNFQLPGLHNVYNALAALSVGMELEIPFPLIQQALEGFSGIQRRFEIKGEAGKIMVVDDYGHHPTEIRATLRAARQGWRDRRLVVVFQPHRYSRTEALLQKFIEAFDEADFLILTRIYPAGEAPIPGVEADLISQGIQQRNHPPILYLEEKEDILRHLRELKRPGDIILTLGAGDIWKVGEAFWKEMEKQEARSKK
jgi:UDP-N-acetylmuramate--alanine ligase